MSYSLVSLEWLGTYWVGWHSMYVSEKNGRILGCCESAGLKSDGEASVDNSVDTFAFVDVSFCKASRKELEREVDDDSTLDEFIFVRVWLCKAVREGLAGDGSGRESYGSLALC